MVSTDIMATREWTIKNVGWIKREKKANQLRRATPRRPVKVNGQ